jgi:hypothetical protein
MNVLQKIRKSVREETIVATNHAFEEMLNDDLLQADIEHCLLTGRMIAREWDEDWQEWKYVIAGSSLTDDEIEVVVKLNALLHAVVITTYRL